MSGGRKYAPLEDTGRAAGAENADERSLEAKPYEPVTIRTELDDEIDRIHARAAELKAQGVANVGYELAKEDTEKRFRDDARAQRAREQREAAQHEPKDSRDDDRRRAGEDDAKQQDRQRSEAERAQTLGKYDPLRDAAAFGDIELTDAQRERLERLMGADDRPRSDLGMDGPERGQATGRSDGGRGRSR